MQECTYEVVTVQVGLRVPGTAMVGRVCPMMSVVTLLNFYAILGAVAGLLTKIPRVLSFPRFQCEGFP